MSQIKTRIVIRNDSTVNWNANQSQVLLKGELGIEFTEEGKAKIKIGDGIKTWAELDYFANDGAVVPVQFFEAVLGEDETHVSAIARVVGETTLNQGDFAVVKTLIANEKYEYTGYIYSGELWQALNGNYNAENVYFDQDLLTTSAIGNITLTNGQATIAAQGKNLKQVFDTIFVKEKNPTITQPSVSVSSPETKAYEVGTEVTPTYTATFNQGKYQYQSSTGVEANEWSVVDTAGNTLTTQSGTFPAIVVGDDTSYKITATATYGDGIIPVTNTGNEYAAGKIVAGSKSGTTSVAITGYRNSFYGTFDTKAEINSDQVRTKLTKSNKALVNGSTFNVTIPVGALRVVIAYPATLQDVVSITDVNGMNAEIKSSFTKSVIAVEGANSYTAINYKVYVLDFANANDTANTFTVKI